MVKAVRKYAKNRELMQAKIRHWSRADRHAAGPQSRLFLYKEVRNIVIKRKDHQGQDDQDTNLLSNLSLAQAQGRTVDDFYGKKHQVATIQHRNRQQIDDRETDADRRCEKDQVTPSNLRLAPEFAGNANRAGQAVGSRYRTGYNFSKTDKTQPSNFPRPGNALAERRDWIGALQRQAGRAQSDANAELARSRVLLRRDRNIDMLRAPLDTQRNRIAAAPLNVGLELVTADTFDLRLPADTEIISQPTFSQGQ